MAEAAYQDIGDSAFARGKPRTFEEAVNILREDLGIIFNYLLSKKPVYYSAVTSYRIELVEFDKPVPPFANGTTIVIPYEWYVSETFYFNGHKKLLLVLVHEALHNMFLHPFRGHWVKEKYGVIGRAALQVAADAIVDVYMKADFGAGNQEIVGEHGKAVDYVDVARFLDVEFGWVEKAHMEEIAERLAEKMSRMMSREMVERLQGLLSELESALRGGPPTGQQSAGSLGVEGLPSFEELLWDVVLGSMAPPALPKRKATVWRGHESLLQQVERAIAENRVEEAAAKVAADIAARAATVKRVGVGPGLLEITLENLAEGTIDWASIVRRTVAAAMSGRRRRTWSRLNKKLPHVRPGRTGARSVKEIIAVIDVSGSISDEEYKEFAGEVLKGVEDLNPRKLRVVLWDWGVRRVVETTASAAREALKKRTGGGGTSITEALLYAERLADPGKLVVVASDWAVSEEAEEVAKLIGRIASKAQVVVLAPPEHEHRVFSAAASAATAAVVLKERNPLRRAGV